MFSAVVVFEGIFDKKHYDVSTHVLEFSW